MKDHMLQTHKKSYPKKNSIYGRLLLPMVIVAVSQIAIFLGILFWGGVAEGIDANAYGRFTQEVTSGHNEFQSNMYRWINVERFAAQITSLYADKTTSLVEDQKNTKFLMSTSEVLLTMLRENSVNGAYFILAEEEDATPSAAAPQVHHGVGIRDLDASTSNDNNEDILFARAPIGVATELGFALDANWESAYTFTDEAASAYYYKPLRAAQANESRSSLDYGYWYGPHQLSGTDTAMLSFSVPVFQSNGDLLGILGAEVSVNSLKAALPVEKLDENRTGVYTLARKNQEGEFTPVLSTGYMASRYFQETVALQQKDLTHGCYSFSVDKMQLTVVAKEINTYQKNSPFVAESFYLLGAMDEDVLLSFGETVKNSLLVASFAAFMISMVGAFFVGRIFTKPVLQMVAKVKRSSGKKRPLGRVGIAEIDELIEAIEQLGNSVADSENKVAEIILASGMLIGTFEIDRRTDQVFISDGFSQIAQALFPSQGNTRDLVGFEQQLQGIEQFVVLREQGDNSKVYYFPDTQRFLRIKIADNTARRLGIALDVTAEMKEREKIEYERDHDLLTDLFNRRAFHKQLDLLFEAPKELGVAAMVMMDVDNLKYVNDSFGHDCGDLYLQKVASLLKLAEGEREILSRISGDEFLLFLHGGASREEIEGRIDAVRKCFAQAHVTIAGGEKIRVRVSGGIAWYPEDSTNQGALVRFADFAMLQTKKTHKGNFDYFSSEDYRQNRYLVESVDEINRLIEEELLDFYFQPIFDIVEGEIYGYEALMRPMSGTIKGPQEALSLAEAVGSLYQMERLTWMGALRKFQEHIPQFQKDTKLFVNSIPNQSLSEEDSLFIENTYGHLLPRLVVEMIETDRVRRGEGSTFTWMRDRGVEYAIDDYGSGYNGQTVLLESGAEYVKIDMTIVRGVHADVDRQEVIRGMVKYGGERGIRIIAEGVETPQELQALRALGVRYIQGYLLQRPVPLPVPLSAETLALLRPQ